MPVCVYDTWYLVPEDTMGLNHRMQKRWGTISYSVVKDWGHPTPSRISFGYPYISILRSIYMSSMSIIL